MFRCACGNSALKITGVVGGRTLVRCPLCGTTKPINECAHDARWATVLSRLEARHDREARQASRSADSAPPVDA
jgi:hypothetical protein